MATKTQIVNLALQRIGCSQFVANADSEDSTEARAARLAFDDERDYALRSFPWPFATAYATLGLVAGSSSSRVNYDWTFAYRHPPDCLEARRIVTPNGRKETVPPAFRIGRDSQGRLIYTDQEQAQLEYTIRIADAVEFDALFVSALAWRLAHVLAPALSRIEGKTEDALKMFLFDLSRAEAGAMNEGQSDEPPEAEWIRAR